MRFDVQFNHAEQKIDVQFNGGKKSFDVAFQNTQIVTAPDAEYYEGEYSVIPAVDAQVIPTAHKLMKDDLTVKAIPTYNVSNTSGGSTFYIATMDEDPSGAAAILGEARLGQMVL